MTQPTVNYLADSKLFTIDGLFSQEECKKLINDAEAKGFKPSAPSGGGHGRTGREEPRTSHFYVNVDEQYANDMWKRVQSFIPKDLTHLSYNAYVTSKDDAKKWTPVGVNPRLRFYRYEKGQAFPEHFDYKQGRDVIRNGEKYRQQTFMSLILYLNEDFSGGVTGYWTHHDEVGVTEHCRFLSKSENKSHDAVVTPKTGLVSVADQCLMHEGTKVEKGVKFILRTDLVHEKFVGFHPKVKATLKPEQLADHVTEWERIFESSCKNYAD